MAVTNKMVVPSDSVAVPKSFFAQIIILVKKNWTIQKRKPMLTMAEYFIVVCYLLFYYKLMYVIFPDDRPTAAELVKFENDLDASIPSSLLLPSQQWRLYLQDVDFKVLLPSRSRACFFPLKKALRPLFRRIP